MADRLILKSRIIADNPFDIDKFLISLAKLDNDFNGKNGDDALWEISKTEGFKSNFDYVMYTISRETDGVKKIEKFVEMWMKDNSYYKNRKVDVSRKGKKLFISIAFIVEE